MDGYALAISGCYGNFGPRLRGTWELTEHGKCGWRYHMDNRRRQENSPFGAKAHLERVLGSQRDRRLRERNAAVIIQAFLRTTLVRVKLERAAAKARKRAKAKRRERAKKIAGDEILGGGANTDDV